MLKSVEIRNSNDVNKMSEKNVAIIQVVFATVIWGFGFIATKIGFRYIDSYGLMTLRFFAATLVGLPFIFFNNGYLTHVRLIKGTVIPGFLMSLALVTQSLGLESTSTAKSAFFTTLYVLFVPFVEPFLLRGKNQLLRRFFPFLVFSIFGAFFMTMPTGSEFNNGDLLTIVCAITCSIHIVWLSRVQANWKYGKVGAFAFNVYQSAWAFVFSFASWILIKDWNSIQVSVMTLPIGNMEFVLSFIFLAVISTLIAFTFQVRAQEFLAPLPVSIIYLLESPFAAVFAFFIFGEIMMPIQIFGATLVLISALGVIYRSLSIAK